MEKRGALQKICRALKGHDRFLLSCHVAPEGDAICSLLALESLLRRLGKKTTMVCEDSFPERYSWLPSKRWYRLKDIKKSKTSFQSIVVADCPDMSRIGQVRTLVAPEAVIFNLDHHVSNTNFGHYNYVFPEAAATGEVVVDLFRYFRMPLTKREATYIYVALSTDTGSFKYSNTTVQSHRIVAELIESGIDLERINERLYSTYSLKKTNLFGRLLSRVQTTAKGRIGWSWLKRGDLEDLGATDEDTEGFIDFLRFLREVDVVFFMTERPGNHVVKVSFRSKGLYDVNKIATYFGGGGHRKASGCTIQGALRRVQGMVLSRLDKEFKLR